MRATTEDAVGGDASGIGWSRPASSVSLLRTFGASAGPLPKLKVFEGAGCAPGSLEIALILPNDLGIGAEVVPEER